MTSITWSCQGFNELNIACSFMWPQPTNAQRKALTTLTSKKRLKSYRRAMNGHEEPALDLYILDSQLSSLMHGHFRQIEVVLREQMNQALTAAYGRNWFLIQEDGSTPAGLGNTCRDMVKKAQNNLNREAGKPWSKSMNGISADKMVAELTMGFWAKLLATPGDADHASTIWSAGVSQVFNQQHVGDAVQWSQHDAMKICQRLTWARNRVNHCESVVFGFPQKGMRHKGKQLRLSPKLILENCRSLAGRFDPNLEQWMRDSAVADELMEHPSVVSAWTGTEKRSDVITENSAPEGL